MAGSISPTLKCMLRIVLQQLELECHAILRALDEDELEGPGGFVLAKGRLAVWEDNLWAAASPETFLGPSMFGDDSEMAESIGRLALALAMVLMPMNRLHEAHLAAGIAHRTFLRHLHMELLPAAVAHRQANPSVAIKAPSALAAAVRVLAEVKMSLGAYESALKDLDLAYLSLEPLNVKVLGMEHRGVFLCRADVLWLTAECLVCLGDPARLPRASQVLGTCLQLYEDSSDDVGRALALQLDGNLRMMTGKVVDAHASLTEAVRLLKHAGDIPRLCDTLCIRAQLCLGILNLGSAREDLATAIRLLKQEGNLMGLSVAYRLTAEVEMAVNDYLRAEAALQRALTCARAVFNNYLEACALQLLGDLNTNLCVPGQKKPLLGKAKGYLDKALDYFLTLGNELGIGNTRRALARVYRMTKHWGHALQELEAAEVALGKVGPQGHELGLAVVKVEIAEIEQRMGKHGAREKLAEALPAFETVTKQLNMANTAGLFEAAQDRYREQSADLYSKSFREQEAPRVETDPFWSRHLHKLNPRSAGAETAGDLVREVFGEMGTVWSLGGAQDPSHIERRVGYTGVPHLDLNQVWSAEGKWEYSDSRDMAALDRVQEHYMLASDWPRRQRMVKESAEVRHRFLTQIGLRSPDGSINAFQVRKAFQAVDVDESGLLDREELNNAFESIGVFLDKMELDEIFEKYDPDNNGLDVEEFLKMLQDFVQDIREKEPAAASARPTAPPPAAASAPAAVGVGNSARPRRWGSWGEDGTAGGEGLSAVDPLATASRGAGGWGGAPAAGPPGPAAGTGAAEEDRSESMRKALQAVRLQALREEAARRQAAAAAAKPPAFPAGSIAAVQ